MKVKQIFNIVNTMANDILGKPNYLGSDGKVYPDNSERYTEDGTRITYPDGPSWQLSEDLTEIVDIGTKIFDTTTVDNYVRMLIDHIGKVIFVDRKYSPIVPSVLKDGWEYGSILEKIDADMPESEANPKWELEDGKVYEQDKFRKPKNVRVKFFNSAVTFQIRMSYTEDQVKESFSSLNQLNAFFSMIETKIRNRMAVNYANLIRGTINSMIAGTVYEDAKDLLNTTTHEYDFSANNSYVRTINLLGEYKNENPDNLTRDQLTALTPSTAMKNLRFLKYCAYKIMLVSDRMADISTLYNIGGKERFTPKDLQHIVLLSDFEKAANVYLESDTFHNELSRLPKAESINYWQGTGNDYSFNSVSRIHVVSKVMDEVDGEIKPVDKETIVKGVIGIIFDHDALGVNNEREKTTSHYNANGDFINNFYKSFARYFNDFDENCVVFIVA